MGMSQGNFSSGPTGLNLKAWGLINGTTGAIVRQSGFATLTRSAAGTYAFTFSAAAADTNYLIVAKSENTAGSINFAQLTNSKTTAGATVINSNIGTGSPFDSVMTHIEVYT